jgi:hypothetical protein
LRFRGGRLFLLPRTWYIVALKSNPIFHIAE